MPVPSPAIPLLPASRRVTVSLVSILLGFQASCCMKILINLTLEAPGFKPTTLLHVQRVITVATSASNTSA